MQLTNQPPPYNKMEIMFQSLLKIRQQTIAHANTVGYILLILRL